MRRARLAVGGLLGASLLGALSCSPTPVLPGARLDALAALAEEVREERLMGLVSEVVDAHQRDTPVDCGFLQPREQERFGDPYCHLSRERAGALLEARFQQLGLSVRRQETPGSPFSTSNLVVDLPGTTRPEEIVLVGAHYDAFYGGADDNTTGVAALVELARVLSRHRFERTVRIVAFDYEEVGLVGSARFLEAQRDVPERLVAAMIFDCIGYYDSRPGSQRSLPGLPTPSAGDFLGVISNEQSSARAVELNALNQALGFLKVVPIIAPGDGTGAFTGNLLRSDHAPFWLRGDEALFLTDTANFRNPHYHRSTDTVDTLNPALYLRAVRLSAATLGYWAGGPLP